MTLDVEVQVRSREVGDRPDAGAEGPEAFYRAHAATLTKFATTLVGPSDAGDVVSNAMAKTLAARGWSTLDNPRAYVYRAVYREAMSWRRAAARRSVRHRLDAERLSAVDRGVVDDDVLPSRVAEAVAKLSDRQRAVVVLTYWDDRAISEVAVVMGTSEGAVKKHLARARAALREMLPRDDEVE